MVHFSDILMVLKDPRLKSCQRIYTIDFSVSLELKSPDILPSVYQIVSYLKISFILFA